MVVVSNRANYFQIDVNLLRKFKTCWVSKHVIYQIYLDREEKGEKNAFLVVTFVENHFGLHHHAFFVGRLARYQATLHHGVDDVLAEKSGGTRDLQRGGKGRDWVKPRRKDSPFLPVEMPVERGRCLVRLPLVLLSLGQS